MEEAQRGLRSRLAISRAAIEDLSTIYDYSAVQWGPDRAEQYVRDIEATYDLPARGMRKGRPLSRDITGYLKLSVGSHFVIFRQDRDTIFITRILHQRMNLRMHLEHE